MANNGYLDAALEQFVEHLVVERGLAPLTLEAYASDLAGLRAFLPALGRERWDQVTLPDLQSFLDHLEGQGVGSPQSGPETQRRPPVLSIFTPGRPGRQ